MSFKEFVYFIWAVEYISTELNCLQYSFIRFRVCSNVHSSFLILVIYISTLFLISPEFLKTKGNKKQPALGFNDFYFIGSVLSWSALFPFCFTGSLFPLVLVDGSWHHFWDLSPFQIWVFHAMNVPLNIAFAI